MHRILLLLTVATLLHAPPLHAESSRFRTYQNKEQTKSFEAELTGYDITTKIVTVRRKNGRLSKFPIDILHETDQAYILSNAERLAIAEDISLSLTEYTLSTRKETKPLITNRIYPSGYIIKLKNRSQKTYTNLELNYTLYYQTQGYTSSKRIDHTKDGTLTCQTIPPRKTATLKTATVDIVSGKLEPVLGKRRVSNGDGTYRTDEYVVRPGGRKKDLLLGCKVDIILDGEIIKTLTEGTIKIENP